MTLIYSSNDATRHPFIPPLIRWSPFHSAYRQSRIGRITDSVKWVETQFKDKSFDSNAWRWMINKQEAWDTQYTNVSVGLFNYPVLMDVPGHLTSGATYASWRRPDPAFSYTWSLPNEWIVSLAIYLRAETRNSATLLEKIKDWGLKISWTWRNDKSRGQGIIFLSDVP